MPETDGLIRVLRTAGLAAVVSGAGPSILVLASDPAQRLDAALIVEDAADTAWQACCWPSTSGVLQWYRIVGDGCPLGIVVHGRGASRHRSQVLADSPPSRRRSVRVSRPHRALPGKLLLSLCACLRHAHRHDPQCDQFSWVRNLRQGKGTSPVTDAPSTPPAWRTRPTRRPSSSPSSRPSPPSSASRRDPNFEKENSWRPSRPTGRRRGQPHARRRRHRRRRARADEPPPDAEPPRPARRRCTRGAAAHATRPSAAPSAAPEASVRPTDVPTTPRRPRPRAGASRVGDERDRSGAADVNAGDAGVGLVPEAEPRGSRGRSRRRAEELAAAPTRAPVPRSPPRRRRGRAARRREPRQGRSRSRGRRGGEPATERPRRRRPQKQGERRQNGDRQAQQGGSSARATTPGSQGDDRQQQADGGQRPRQQAATSRAATSRVSASRAATAGRRRRRGGRSRYRDRKRRGRAASATTSSPRSPRTTC